MKPPATATRRAAFSAEQLKRLSNLGLLSEQIDRLRVALPRAARQLQPAPPVAAVRKVLAGLEADASRAERSIDSVLTLRHRSDQREYLETYELLAYRAQLPGEKPSDGLELDRALQALAELRSTLALVMNEINGRPQTRGGSASPVPVRMLHRALADGWSDANPDDPFMPEAFRHSKQTFKDVISICYEAITGKTAFEPERALKNYSKVMSPSRTPGRRDR